ncbi:MAG: glycerol-3-phosphate 1-O-acyltransferase PlsY [Gemmatimonadaceae bacterium]
MHPIVALLSSYLLGSIPAAWIAGRATGIDLRTRGSGNLGATNVFRVLGWKIGLAVFLFDAAKGAVPVRFFPALTGERDPQRLLLLAMGCGLAAIAGHVRPVFLGFGKGGKGVATSAGVFFALAPVATAITLAIFSTVVLVSGYVSLGSLVASVVLVAMLAGLEGLRSPLFLLAVILGGFVFWTHRANIGRLRRGEEHRFGRKAGKAAR